MSSSNCGVAQIAEGEFNKRWFTWFALLITLLGVSSTDIYISSLPTMVTEFATTPNVINLTISTYTLGMAFGVLFAGNLSDRYGRKNTLQAGILLYILASFGIAYVSSIELIIALRIAQAIGCAFIAIIPRLIMKDTMTPKEQMHASGILIMGVVISPAIAPSIGTLLASQWGWKSCFEFSGALGLVLLLLGHFLIKETNTTPVKALQHPLAYIVSYWQLLQDKVCLYFTLIIGLTLGTYFAFIGISSYLFIDSLGMSPINYSYIFILIAAGFFVGNSAMLWLNKQHSSPMRIIHLGSISGSIGLFIMLLSLLINQKVFIGACIIIGVLIMRAASALIIAPAQVKLMEHFKSRGAEALSLATCAQFGLSSLAVSLVALFHSAPLDGLLLISLSCFVPVILILAKLKRAIN